MEKTYKEYLDLMKELGEILEQLTETAAKKMDAASKDDLKSLDECIRQEQALSLFVRNIERKREKLLEELGLPQVTLSALPGYFPESLRMSAKDTAETVRYQYLTYMSASDAARTTLECALHQIERMFREASPELGAPASTKADIRA